MLAISGGDITFLTDDKRKIGQTIDTLLNSVIDGNLPNEREALLGAAKDILTK